MDEALKRLQKNANNFGMWLWVTTAKDDDHNCVPFYVLTREVSSRQLFVELQTFDLNVIDNHIGHYAMERWAD
jgi:hypothetical protein